MTEPIKSIEWTATIKQQDEIDGLDPMERVDYVFARDFGLTHQEALDVANDFTGQKMTQLQERIFG